MTAHYPLPSFGALLGYHPSAPRIIPDTLDDVLSQRWDAEIMAARIVHETQQPYRLASLQMDFSRRLGAIAARRAQE